MKKITWLTDLKDYYPVGKLAIITKNVLEKKGRP